jgi:hypothetical protein
MVWLFEHGDEALRIETRYDATTAMYVLIVHGGQGSEIERFEDADSFRTRLEALEQQLERNEWRRTGPFMLADGWRIG